MDTEEEEKLERLQHQREKLVGVVKDGLNKLPQNGYTLSSIFKGIEENEKEYKKFRELLKSKRQSLKELDQLDEMINDFNYVMFHQHFFGELNEFDLAKRDQWFNSPGLDLLFQDYCGIVGLDAKHSMALSSACQYMILFPFVLILDLFFFNNSEIWVSLSSDGFTDLFNNCDYVVLLVILAFSILTLLRPMTQYHGMTKLSIP